MKIRRILNYYPYIGCTGFIVSILLIIIIGKVIEGSAGREWSEELRMQPSPFICGSCRKPLSKEVVLNMSGGLVKGFCPHCGARLLDSALLSGSGGVSGLEIVNWQSRQYDDFRKRYGILIGPGEFVAIVIGLFFIWFLITLFLENWRDKLQGAVSPAMTGPSPPSQPDKTLMPSGSETKDTTH